MWCLDQRCGDTLRDVIEMSRRTPRAMCGSLQPCEPILIFPSLPFLPALLLQFHLIFTYSLSLFLVGLGELLREAWGPRLPNQGLNLWPLQWKYRVRTPGPAENSSTYSLLSLPLFINPFDSLGLHALLLLRDSNQQSCWWLPYA